MFLKVLSNTLLHIAPDGGLHFQNLFTHPNPNISAHAPVLDVLPNLVEGNRGAIGVHIRG